MVFPFDIDEKSAVPITKVDNSSNFRVDMDLLLTLVQNFESFGVTNYRVRINDSLLVKAMFSSFGFGDEDHSQIFFIFGLMNKIGRIGVIGEIKGRDFHPDAAARLVGYILRTKVAEEQNICDELALTDLLPPEVSKEARQYLLNFVAAVPNAYREKMIFDPFLVNGIGYGTGIIFDITTD